MPDDDPFFDIDDDELEQLRQLPVPRDQGPSPGPISKPQFTDLRRREPPEPPPEPPPVPEAVPPDQATDAPLGARERDPPAPAEPPPEQPPVEQQDLPDAPPRAEPIDPADIPDLAEDDGFVRGGTPEEQAQWDRENEQRVRENDQANDWLDRHPAEGRPDDPPVVPGQEAPGQEAPAPDEVLDLLQQIQAGVTANTAALEEMKQTLARQDTEIKALRTKQDEILTAIEDIETVSP